MQEEIVHRDDRTEERILEAALDVIEEKTISGTRMRLIADRAELFQSNIHYYYKSKQDLLLAVQKRVLKKCIDLRKSGIHPPGEDIDSQL
ncbi:MAG: helix-turn-helix domain-containing protein, partial [Hungatella sp.]